MRDNGLSWDGLEEAVAIADAGTFAGGAAILGKSTSHVSRMVAQLESRLGATLFHRTTRRVSLTDTGRAFVERSRRIIQDRNELLSLVDGSGEPQGELRISCSITLGERFVAPIVRRFAEAYPRLAVALDLSNRLVDIVGEGYDMAVRTGHVSDARLVGCQIGFRSIALCASPDYLAAAGTPQSIDDLKGHQCLIGSSPNWHFLDRDVARVFAPSGRWRCNNGAAVVDAAVAGMGICQLPSFYVRRHIEEGTLIPLLARHSAAPEPVFAVYPQRRHLLPKVRNLVRILERQLPNAIEPAVSI